MNWGKRGRRKRVSEDEKEGRPKVNSDSPEPLRKGLEESIDECWMEEGQRIRWEKLPDPP